MARQFPICVFSPLMRGWLGGGLAPTLAGFSLLCIPVSLSFPSVLAAYYEVWEIPVFRIIVLCLASLCRSFENVAYFLTLSLWVGLVPARCLGVGFLLVWYGL